MDYENLKARRRAERHGFHANLSLRAHRGQIRGCGKFTAKRVPRLIEILRDHPQTPSGDACCPVVSQ